MIHLSKKVEHASTKITHKPQARLELKVCYLRGLKAQKRRVCWSSGFEFHKIFGVSLRLRISHVWTFVIVYIIEVGGSMQQMSTKAKSINPSSFCNLIPEELDLVAASLFSLGVI